MLAHTNRLFQLSLTTAFATLLFLGTMGVNTALAEALIGKLKGTEYCDAGEGFYEKSKFSEEIGIVLDTTLFPFISVTEGFDASGVALAKNAKQGIFTLTDTSIFDVFTMSGKYKSKKNTGEIVLLTGNFLISRGDACIITGKFKLKTFIPLPS